MESRQGRKWPFIFGVSLSPLLRACPRRDGETLLESDRVKGGRHPTQGMNPVRKAGEKLHFREVNSVADNPGAV